MVWAGAVKTIFNDFYRELNPKGVRLTMNHRSAPRLVALQKAMYESLKEKATEVCVSDNWAENDGNIALFIADNEQLEASAVSKDILSKISNGVEPHDICILCKQKPQDYASAIIEKLEQHGVRARIETGYQNLIKEPIVDLLIKFMICAESRKQPNEWWKVPLYCMVASWICFQLEIRFLGRWAIVTLPDGSISSDNTRWMLMSAGLFLAVVCIGGFFLFRKMTRKEIFFSSSALVALNIVLGIFTYLTQRIFTSFAMLWSELSEWASVFPQIAFQFGLNEWLSAAIVWILPPYIFLLFGKKEVHTDR